jgi:hypothetical protein
MGRTPKAAHLPSPPASVPTTSVWRAAAGYRAAAKGARRARRYRAALGEGLSEGARGSGDLPQFITSLGVQGERDRRASGGSPPPHAPLVARAGGRAQEVALQC